MAPTAPWSAPATYRGPVKSPLAVLASSLSAAALLLVSLVPAASAAPASAPSAMPRVINGEQVPAGSYPFLVSLLGASRYASQGAYQAQFCGGTLTTPTTVVTAAHCVVDEDNGAVTGPGAILVGFGANLNGNVRVVNVAAVTPNPNYNRNTTQNDVAVLTLATPVTDVTTLSPLSPNEAAGYMAAGTALESVGWGNTSTGDEPVWTEVPLLARLILFPDNTCGGGANYTYNGVRWTGFGPSDADPNTMVCAGGLTAGGARIDTCQGDSGGPLIAGAGAAARLVGIVSWGVDCAGPTPGVYTRVSSMYDFLTSQNAIGAPAPQVAPTQPPTLAVAPGNAALTIAFTAAADGATVQTFAATVTDPATGAVLSCFAAPTATGTGTCTVAGLVNGTTYSVSGISANSLGNSPAAAAQSAVPLPLPTAGRITKVRELTRSSALFRVTASSGNGAPLLSEVVVCVKAADGSGARFGTVRNGQAVVRKLKSVRYVCVLRVENQYGTADSDAKLLNMSRPNAF